MTPLWIFTARVAVAASYLTLAIAHPSAAKGLALPYAAVVLLVFLLDLVSEGRRARQH